ncbi:inositol monophosphatase family protein [Chelativorans salis]|uniref:Inositol-1-monophosphatase n=1 Tax=Chelativorans salis TaxID=2978478 RepID=A0ABT2LHM3_9HYPH|nr:inositol monophosphatase family protein [Chelativorans sp. EGI FJ00035]MCT7373943.1 inositol monophosphatase [Chelativorans sp. EGI FJ00035]
MTSAIDHGISERLALARKLAAAVGGEIEAFHEEARSVVTRKGLQDFVTAADRHGEDLIRSALAEAFPEDGFVGEETGGQPAEQGFWVVDPIDGTTNYIRGLRHWGVSIAFVRAGRIEIGCIYDATTGRVYSAARGKGTFCEDRRIAVSPRQDPNEALAILGCSRRTSFEDYQAVTRKLHDLGVDYRRLGSAAIGLVRVANGVADLYFEAHLNCWDIMAGALIASEAGAIVVMPPLQTMLRQGGPLAAYAPSLSSTFSFVHELVALTK